MTSAPVIVGAGLAGLIAAHAWPRSLVLEGAAAPVATHRALLRFRTDSVAKLTGVDFRKVRVHKGICHNGEFVAPSIRSANMYAQKCLSVLGARSIWNVDAVDRWVAPENLYERLVDAVADRVQWGCEVDFKHLLHPTPIVSTAPLPVVLESLGVDYDRAAGFQRAAIQVNRFRVHNADVFQTVYFPGDETCVYRASITGDLLICESAAERKFADADLATVASAFALRGELTPIDFNQQRYGKIAPIDEKQRKELIWQLSNSHNIFSLGRFATWRNILLDDVVDDVVVVRRLLAASSYDRRRAMA